ncbi:hypothetical protein GCM10022246_24670 [Pedobacter ginsengiterrae]|uniref:SLH domain-containing protein n=1 Tax=Pedobacter ginsengiterrae TaxID=871696 RepID=A0ABP7PWJ0_9SPHI
MAWGDLAANQLISGQKLQEAVSSGIFNLKSGQVIPNTNKILTRSQANTFVDIFPIPNDNRALRKFELIAMIFSTRVWIGSREREYANFSSEDIVGQAKAGIISSNSHIMYSSQPFGHDVKIYWDANLSEGFNLRAYVTDGVNLYKSYRYEIPPSFAFGIYIVEEPEVNRLFSYDFKWSEINSINACAGGSTTIWGFSYDSEIKIGTTFNIDGTDAEHLSRNGKWYKYGYIANITAIGDCLSYYIINQSHSYAYDQYSSIGACSVLTQVGDLYTTNSNGIVQIGDYVYSDASGTEIYPLGYYSYIEASERIWILVQLSGGPSNPGPAYVSNKGTCGSVRNFSLYQSGRRLELSADNGTIGTTLSVNVYYTVTDFNGNDLGPGYKLITLSPGTSSVNTSNITAGPGDTINITDIIFSPSFSDGYTLYVNGYSGNNGEV